MRDTADPLTLMHPEIVEAHRILAEQEEKLGRPTTPAEERAFVEAIRPWWNEGGPDIAAVEDATIPGPARQIPVTLYRGGTGDGAPVFVYFHGGAFRTGYPRANDRQLREIVYDWGGTVVSADYAHVPEHHFPVAMEEAAAIFTWLNGNGAGWGLDGSRLGYGGYSAGAPVAIGAGVHLGEAATAWIKAGVSVSGLLAFDRDLPSMHRFDGGAFFPYRDHVIQTVEGYAPTEAMRQDPRANPVCVDPALVPPFLVCAAELDTLADGSRRFAERLTAAGRPCELKVYEGMTHRFFGFSRTVACARQCCADIAAFLTRELGS